MTVFINLFTDVLSGLIPFLVKVLKPLAIFIAVLLIMILTTGILGSWAGFVFSAPYVKNFGPQIDFMSWVGVISLFIILTVPLVWIIQLLFRVLWKSRWPSWISGSLIWGWSLAWVFFIYSAVSTARDYSYTFSLALKSDYPEIKDKMTITMPDKISDQQLFFHLGDWSCAREKDKWIINNTEIQLEKSHDDQIHLQKIIYTMGSNESRAKEYAESVSHFLALDEDHFMLSKYINIPISHRFRNQKLVYKFYIPEKVTVDLDKTSYQKLKEKSHHVFESQEVNNKLFYRTSM